MTPLEHKQIQIQAKQDVLFEQKTGKKTLRNNVEDEENGGDIPDKASELTTKSKSKSKSKDKKSRRVDAVKEAALRIEGLSYKVLVPITWRSDD